MTDLNSMPDPGTLRLQWLLGDWLPLAELRHTDLATHDERTELVMLAIVGCQQIGLYPEAAELVKLATHLGCRREEISRWMLAALRCTLARAHAAAGDRAQSLLAYQLSISEAPGGVDSEDLALARSNHQARILSAKAIPSSLTMPVSDRAGHKPTFQRPAIGITSYAQNFEDVMLWRALGHVVNGYYIDIGAQDPIVDSVSKAFYENGWRGLHVEPTPAYAELLKRDRPDETVLECAVGSRIGSIDFFEIADTGISTGDPEIAASHSLNGFEVKKIRVSTVPLSELLDGAGEKEIHWLKIDVEGMEREVLESWGASIKRPWVIVVESTIPLTEIDIHCQWEAHLLDREYKHVYFDGLNRFYLAMERLELEAAFSCGPNVFDRSVLSGLASATFYRRPPV